MIIPIESSNAEGYKKYNDSDENLLGTCTTQKRFFDSVFRREPLERCAKELHRETLYIPDVSTTSGVDIRIGSVRRLRPVSFNWKDGGMPVFGLVAGEVAEVVPAAVSLADCEPSEAGGSRWGVLVTPVRIPRPGRHITPTPVPRGGTWRRCAAIASPATNM